MKKREKLTGKIAHVDNNVLGFRANTRGHYVFIRKDNGDTVDVNVITSLEDKDGHYPKNKFNNVVNGNTIPLPKKGNKSFKRWSGVSTTKITNIPKKNLRVDDSYEISNKYKVVIRLLCNKKKRGK